MSGIVVALIFGLIAFAIGGIPFGLIIASVMAHEDIRKLGSGNIGTTNVARNAGKAAGILTLLCDALKGFISVMLVRLFLSNYGFVPLVSGNSTAEAELVVSFVYACCVLGHIFSPWLHFHGGKGIAVGFGGGLAVNPFAALLALAVFFTLAIPTRYVSLGSIGAAVAIPIFCLLFGMDVLASIPVFVVGATVIWAHRSNIQKLNAGNERKFSFGDKKKDK